LKAIAFKHFCVVHNHKIDKWEHFWWIGGESMGFNKENKPLVSKENKPFKFMSTSGDNAVSCVSSY
jgi:hypothetical protein